MTGDNDPGEARMARGGDGAPENPHPDTRMLLQRFRDDPVRRERSAGLVGPPGSEHAEPPRARSSMLGAFFTSLLPRFARLVGLVGLARTRSAPDEPKPPAQMSAEETDRLLREMGGLKGLALSGGGIRSATLSLGVLQAIAGTNRLPAGAPGLPASFEKSLLSDFRVLSTVSGGGYVGAFLCSLFIPDRLRRKAPGHAWQQAAATAADDAVKVLCNQPPGRVRAVPALTVSPMRAPAKPAAASTDRFIQGPLAWLRDNGRYLTPTGAGDGFYVGSLAVRNLASVHYVIGTAMLGVFAALALLESWAGRLPGGSAAKDLLSGCLVGDWWFSPVFLLAGLVLALWSVPAGVAFWIPYPEDDRGRSGAWNGVCWGLALVTALFIGAAVFSNVGADPPDLFWHGVPWGYGAVAVALALVFYRVAHATQPGVGTLRYVFTWSLSTSLQVVGALLALAIIDAAAHTIYAQLTSHGTGKASHIATPAGVMGALIWLVRKVVLGTGSRKPPAWLKLLPWQLLAGTAGVAILALMAVAWGLVAVWIAWQGQPLVSVAATAVQAGAGAAASKILVAAPPYWEASAIVAGMCLLISFAIGRYPSFINLSSLQSFYSARLTRAYLGASNRERFEDHATGDRTKASASEPLASDQVNMDDFIWKGKLSTYAPVHLINVTMNNTDAPGEQLVQRDRKGQPIVVTSLGFSIDGADVTQFQVGKPDVEIDRMLNLGQWTGISGAAVSTGIGRQSSLGLSLLLGAANLRLGAWWKSGCGDEAPAAASRWIARAFPTQTYLFGEFTAKFHGLARPYHYLSDGGHFENTAAYELLRPERRVRLILLCDHGADRGYAFDDLANLIRLVRIDMQIELTVEEGAARDPRLKTWFGVPADFNKPAHACEAAEKASCTRSTADGTPRHEPVAILLRASRGQPAETQAWVIVLKPRVRSDSAADVIQYAKTHPAFPQETTGDQFFDEAQWESYRKLGYDNASAILSPDVWKALTDYIANPPSPAAPGDPADPGSGTFDLDNTNWQTALDSLAQLPDPTIGVALTRSVRVYKQLVLKKKEP